MSTIYKINLPKNRNGESNSLYVDVSKLLVLGDAVFKNRMGQGGYFAEASFVVENHEDPITITIEQPFKLVDNIPEAEVNENNVPTKVAELQLVMDDLRREWEEYTEFRTRNLRR